MQLDSVLDTASSVHSPRRRWLAVARVVWFMLFLLTLLLFVLSLIQLLPTLLHPCAASTCQLTPVQGESLQHMGIGLGAFAAYYVGIYTLVPVTGAVIALLLFLRRRDDWFTLVIGLFLLYPSSTVIEATVSLQGTGLAVLPLLVVLEASYYAVLLLFPDGRFVPRWAWLLLVVWIVWWVANGIVNLVNPQFGWLAVYYPIGYLSALAIQFYRYRRISTVRQRQQTKWVVLGFTVALLANVLYWIVVPYIIAPLALGISQDALQTNTAYYTAGAPIEELAWMALPVSVAIAIQRYQLFDVDVLIRRTLVYTALTLSVVGTYILVVGYLGALLRTDAPNLLISLVATGLVAVLFQPMRGWLQRGVNRLLYGQRDEPYAVLARLGQQVEATLAADVMLTAIVATLAEALKLPYAAISLRQGQEFTFESVATYGSPVDDALLLPLAYQREPVGQLVLGPRQRGEGFSAADRRLLDDLARQVGLAAHAVRLTSDLQRARERLVTTREEERRRLRRDLHDGLGPTLGSMTLQLDTARGLLGRDSVGADAVLVELKAQVQAALADIRRLVYALRPPLLDEVGLVAALRAEIARYQTPELAMTFEGPDHLVPLPAAVEMALYRIAQEALTNVARHARASACIVSLRIGDGGARLEITDNGRGLPADLRWGVGMSSMRERAAELGGVCQIETGSETQMAGGTRVVAHLPLPELTGEVADE